VSTESGELQNLLKAAAKLIMTHYLTGRKDFGVPTPLLVNINSQAPF
jgi:hypothetical protein